MALKKRNRPNILITGTPGTGKSTLAAEVCKRSGLEWLNVAEIAKENNLYSGFDENFACNILDEDAVVDEIETGIEEGGKIVDYHGCDFFPEHWFDIVFVLRTDNTLLYDRLTARGYTGRKLQENIECEIFQTLLDEAKESYQAGIVFELPSNSPDDMDDNLDKVCHWIENWPQAT